MVKSVHISAMGIAALCASLIGGEARADPRDPVAAEALFRQARAAAQRGEYAVACPKFEESYRLDPAPGALLNLADCHEHVGRLARAWEEYLRLADVLPAGDERVSLARERAADLDARVPRLLLELAKDAPAGATVTRDGVAVGSASLGVPLPVDPGEHALVVEAPGRAARRVLVRVGERQQRRVTLAPGEVAPPTGRPIPTTAGVPPEQPRERTGPRVGAPVWIAGGVALGATVTGAIFGLRALSNKAQSDASCVGDACRDASAVDAWNGAKQAALFADVSFGVAVIALGAATFFYLRGESAPEASGRTVHVAPTVGASGGGLAVQGAW